MNKYNFEHRQGIVEDCSTDDKPLSSFNVYKKRPDDRRIDFYRSAYNLPKVLLYMYLAQTPVQRKASKARNIRTLEDALKHLNRTGTAPSRA